MRGDERVPDGMFSYVSLEQRVPVDGVQKTRQHLLCMGDVGLGVELSLLYTRQTILPDRRASRMPGTRLRKSFCSFSLSMLESNFCLMCSRPARSIFLVRLETSSPMRIRILSNFCHWPS